MIKDKFKKLEEILFNYNSIRAEIKNIGLEIEEIEENYSVIQAANFSEKINKNKVSDTTFNALFDREDIIRKLRLEKNNKVRLLNKIDNAIESLKEEEKNIVKYRYIKGKNTWNQIGALLLIDPNYCCNILRPRIINKLLKLIYID